MSTLGKDARVRRIGIVVVLVTCLCLTTIWYGSLGADPRNNVFPGSGNLANDYEAYIGQRVLVTGQVVHADPAVLRVSGGEQDSFNLTITNLSADVSTGSDIQVFGIVRPDDRIEAIKIRRQSESVLWYVWLLSGIGLSWTAWRAIRHWQVNIGAVQFSRRARSVQSRSKGSDSDAEG